MEVLIHAVGNALRNLNYVVACSRTGEALAVDPMDVDWVKTALKENGWHLRWIVNTHHHRDHTAGNLALSSATGATIACHSAAVDVIPGATTGLRSGDTVPLGAEELLVLDTPGHTLSHVCLLEPERQLFSGDTLFNAGAGNCHNGGHPEVLYETFSEIISTLPDCVLLHPGHDYLRRNLEFTLDREPGNDMARERLGSLEPLAFNEPLTLGEEREINTFLRLGEAEITEELQQSFPDRALETPKERFLALRELRNHW